MVTREDILIATPQLSVAEIMFLEIFVSLLIMFPVIGYGRLDTKMNMEHEGYNLD